MNGSTRAQGVSPCAGWPMTVRARPAATRR
jgi:hypothetical protein